MNQARASANSNEPRRLCLEPQDGRSASLTAPNGPSQQLCVRSSLRLGGEARAFAREGPADVWAFPGGLLPQEVVCTENHGTGTALGDPTHGSTTTRLFATSHNFKSLSCEPFARAIRSED